MSTHDCRQPWFYLRFTQCFTDTVYCRNLARLPEPTRSGEEKSIARAKIGEVGAARLGISRSLAEKEDACLPAAAFAVRHCAGERRGAGDNLCGAVARRARATSTVVVTVALLRCSVLY